MAQDENWSDDEMILALAMYLDPQGTQKDDIRIFTSITGRTDGSIKRRWGNYASCDEAYLKAGHTGLSHGGPKVKYFWDLFQQSPAEMFERASAYMEDNGFYREMTFLGEYGDVPDVTGGDIDGIVRMRLGQDKLRRILLNESGNRCCITGISERQILRCSHIVPWSECETDRDKTRLDNVLCLNTFHDSLFDRHLMTVDEDRFIHYAPVLRERMDADIYRTMCEDHSTLRVRKIAPNPDFLRIHNRAFEKTTGTRLSDT